MAASCASLEHLVVGGEIVGRLRRSRRSACSRSSTRTASCRRCRPRRRRRRSITRSETSWCGLAAFGPEPTITKSTWTCPSARMASAIFAPTSRSVRPGLSQSRDVGVHPVDGLARRPQRGRPRRATCGSAAATGRAGQLLRPRREDASRTAARAAPTSGRTARPSAGRPTVSWRSSRTGPRFLPRSPSPRPARTAGEACAAFSSSRGHQQERVAVGGTARQVSRSSCLAS